MIRLTDGACAILGVPGQPSKVGVPGGTFHEIPDEHRAALTAIAQGIATEEELASPGGQYLVERGLAADGLRPVDPRARAQLRRLGQPFAWRLGDALDVELLKTVRDVHARRKLFVAYYGQTSCLPESALARIHLLEQRVPPPARVLLIGDDDFLSLPLALKGYDVTVFDIDEDLVRFLGHMADELGVTVDLRMLDLLQPLPSDVIGAFDAVMTDPMSHVNCLTVFLGRGLAALEEGKPLFTCLHVAGRTALEQVMRQAPTGPLPATVKAWSKGVSAYYISGYTEIHYRSDLLELQRTPAALPVAGDEPMPAIDVTAEDLPWPPHGLGHVEGFRLGARKDATAEDFVAYLASELGVSVRGHQAFEDGLRLHIRIELEGDRRAQVVLDKKRFVGRFYLYPHDDDDGWKLIEAQSAFLNAKDQAFLDPYAGAFVSWLPRWPS